MSIFWYKFKHIFSISFVLVCLPLFALLPPVTTAESGSTQGDLSHNESTYDSPNAITRGMVAGASTFKRTAESIVSGVDAAAYKTSLAIYNGLRQVGKFSVSSYKTIAAGISAGPAFMADATINSFLFIVRGMGNTVSLVTKVPGVSAYIRPVSSQPVPTIKPLATTAAVAHELPALPTPSHEVQHKNSEALWPIHGKVTTLFGVPHRPYQPIHTGIDISSGRRAGATAITPFKSGKVIEALRSKSGLGNYVVVDHGEGLTSVYAHLHRIVAKPGQIVNTNTILGYEGSTGASTGTHLHFEIKVHGKPVNPKSYINNPL